MLCGRCFIQLSYPSMMAGQARQIALRKLEVAVLCDCTFQAQRNGFCALLSDVLACYLSFTHASRLQDFIQIGRTGASITAGQAIDLKREAVQMWCQAGNEIEFNNSAATPIDSVLYPLHRFPVLFATNTGTFEYFQAQHLFAYSF